MMDNIRFFIGRTYKLVSPEGYETKGKVGSTVVGIVFITKDQNGVDCHLPIANAINNGWKIYDL